MHRRDFFRAGAATGAAAAIGTLPASARALGLDRSSPGFRLFDVTTTVELADHAGGAQLWLPLFQSAGGYQKLIGIDRQGNGAATIEHDPVFGAGVLHARWAEGADVPRLTLTQRVATWERTPADTSPAATEAERAFWTRPSAGIPTDGIVRRTAREIVGEIREPRAQARAIYDWVVAKSWRDPAVAGCGTGDVAAMLRDRRFGGKCVDINSLMVGLCRAVGIPARDVYGLRLANSTLFKSLGRSGDVTGAQHCRAEIHLEQEGWVPVDPADVRKAVLEEKLPVDSAPIRALAERLFGSWEANWAGYNSAGGIALAGAPHRPGFHFLMYPCAMTRNGAADCLDAANFSYRITSAEVTA
jgi:transglutaminase-like putative cysteine protease